MTDRVFVPCFCECVCVCVCVPALGVCVRVCCRGGERGGVWCGVSYGSGDLLLETFFFDGRRKKRETAGGGALTVNFRARPLSLPRNPTRCRRALSLPAHFLPAREPATHLGLPIHDEVGLPGAWERDGRVQEKGREPPATEPLSPRALSIPLALSHPRTPTGPQAPGPQPGRRRADQSQRPGRAGLGQEAAGGR